MIGVATIIASDEKANTLQRDVVKPRCVVLPNDTIQSIAGSVVSLTMNVTLFKKDQQSPA